MYREAQLSPEFSQFLEKNRNHNGTTNSESQISTGYKRPADESAGYIEGGMQAVTKDELIGIMKVLKEHLQSYRKLHIWYVVIL